MSPEMPCGTKPLSFTSPFGWGLTSNSPGHSVGKGRIGQRHGLVYRVVVFMKGREHPLEYHLWASHYGRHLGTSNRQGSGKPGIVYCRETQCLLTSPRPDAHIPLSHLRAKSSCRLAWRHGALKASLKHLQEMGPFRNIPAALCHADTCRPAKLVRPFLTGCLGRCSLRSSEGSSERATYPNSSTVLQFHLSLTRHTKYPHCFRVCQVSVRRSEVMKSVGGYHVSMTNSDPSRAWSPELESSSHHGCKCD